MKNCNRQFIRSLIATEEMDLIEKDYVFSYYKGPSDGHLLITDYKPDKKAHPNEKEFGLGYIQGIDLRTGHDFSKKVNQNTKGLFITSSGTPSRHYLHTFTKTAINIPTTQGVIENDD